MNKFRWVLLFLFSGLVAGVNAAHEIPITPEQMERLGIAVGAVTLATQVASDRLPARVVIPPRQERVVSAPSGGLVTRVEAGVGDEVEEGDVLAHIESPSLITLQREYLQAAIDVRLATTALKRDRQLFKEGIIAERRNLETRSTHEQATATLDERRQALSLAGMDETAIVKLSKTRKLASDLSVHTPAQGVVLEEMAVAGLRVERSDPLYRLAQLDPLWLEIRVPLGRLAGVQPGAEVELPCGDGNAHITLIGRNVDPDSQTVLVRAEVREAGECLRPGQFVQVRLEIGSTQQLYRVPASAVVRTSKSAMVFRQAPYGFLAIQVEVVAQDNGYSIVNGKLKVDESVATSGLAAIKAAWLGLGGGAE